MSRFENMLGQKRTGFFGLSAFDKREQPAMLMLRGNSVIRYLNPSMHVARDIALQAQNLV